MSYLFIATNLSFWRERVYGPASIVLFSRGGTPRTYDESAEELFIAQPSLSQTIGHLEKEIGVPLFDRHGRVIRLNQFGKAFLEHVETLFREFEEGQRKVQDIAGLEHGEISLGAAT
jgi:DNA-binding transcriptional LysR family regulator